MPSPVNTTTFTSTSASFTITNSNDPILVAFGSLATAGFSSLTVTDNHSNTYTLIDSAGSGGLGNVGYFLWLPTGAVSGSNTLTITPSGGSLSSLAGIIREYLPTDIASLDKHLVTSYGPGPPAAVASGNTATTTQANETVIGWCYANGNGMTVGTGYGNFQSITNLSSSQTVLEDKGVTATGAQSSSFGGTTQALYFCGVATFKTPTSPMPPGKIYLQSVKRAAYF